MGIGIEHLSPWAQKQAMQKLAEQQRKKQAAGKGSKYHNEKAERELPSGKTLRFDSRKEARRYEVLLAMEQTGAIRELKLQPQFTLQEAYTTTEGERVRAIRYQADFSYRKRPEYWRGYEEQCPDDSWMLVVEDVKSKATKTRVYEMKKKLMREKFGIVIQEV